MSPIMAIPARAMDTSTATIDRVFIHSPYLSGEYVARVMPKKGSVGGIHWLRRGHRPGIRGEDRGFEQYWTTYLARI